MLEGACGDDPLPAQREGVGHFAENRRSANAGAGRRSDGGARARPRA